MKRGITRWTFIAAVVGAIMAVASVPADDKKPADDKAPPPPDAKAMAIDRIGTAYNLTQIGREMKSAESLVVAARLLGTSPINPKAKTETKEDEKNAKAPADHKVDELTVEGLLAEAATLSDKSYIAELIKDTRKDLAEKSRGEIDGPATHGGYVQGFGTSSWTAVFVVGSPGVITVAATCRSPLNVSVTSFRGTSFGNGQSNSTITFYPKETKTYTITIRNPNANGVSYRLIHN